MIRCAAPAQGAQCRCAGVARRGFTLLEMCIVLFILALLVGLLIPTIASAFLEQNLRNDSHQLALMVRTAMVQCAEQHRNYEMDLTSSSMSLHPEGVAPKSTDDIADSLKQDEGTVDTTAVPDVIITQALDPDNKLEIPDPKKDNAWIDMPEITWTFQPGQLCTATRVRMVRGNAYVEMSFAPLTGSIENEASYVP
jgi:prepilin-type N-terminal cleavage/methylation domain-containing protein